MGKGEILLISVLTVIEYISFCYVILKKKWESGGQWAGLAGTVFLFIVLLVCEYDYYPVMYLVSGVVLFFLIRYLYSASLGESARIWLFSFTFICFIETALGAVLKLWIPQGSQFGHMALCSIAVLIVLWIYHLLIGRRISREKFELPTRLWIMAEALLLFYMLMAVFFTYLLRFVHSPKVVVAGIILAFFGGAGAFGMVLAMLYYFNETENYKIQSEMADKYNKQQKDYFLTLLEREQEIKKFRHDIVDHLMVIQGLCTEGDTQIKIYISNMLNDAEGKSYKQFDVGNDIVNVIINYYLIPMQEKCKIVVKGYIGELEAVSGVDLCVIVSNLVKNAVEASSDIQESKGKIHFFISEGNQYLNISVANTYEGKIVFDKKGIPQTNKKENCDHGFGIRNIKRTVEKYNGRCSIKVEGNWYIADIFIKL